MTLTLAALSESISRLASFAAPWLSAIRTGPNRHVTGLMCPEGVILTTDQTLPVLDSYTVALPNRTLVPARPGRRDPARNLAAVQLDAAVPVGFPDIGTAVLGGLLVVLGTDIDASPTVRLAVVHRFLRTPDGPSAVLDLLQGSAGPGGIVLDADGRLIGIVATASDEVVAISSAAIRRMLQPSLTGGRGATDGRGPSNRRGWLGIALQPITVPDQLLARTGQTSGRMIINVTPGGPADRAGIHVGDVVLSLNGDSVTGQNGLRALLAREPIGGEVDIKLLRDGNMVTARLVVAAQP